MKCSVDSCDSDAVVKRMCDLHYQRTKRNGDPCVATRTCSMCSTTFRYQIQKGRRRALCDTCVKVRQLARTSRQNELYSQAKENDPELLERLKKYRFRSNVRRYGITPEQYDDLLAAQGGLCAICSDPPAPNGKGAYSRLHIDHDHQTGTVRGLLCGRCNQGLGYFRDNVEHLASAIGYLINNE